MTRHRLLTIEEATRLIRARKLGAGELLESTISRLEATEPSVRAYANVAIEQARARAAELDEGELQGPLHGIPFGVKDVLETRDVVTEGGSRLLSSHRPAADATVVGSLRRAGAVLIGKHVTHEFASGQNTPPSRNPWDLTRYPGGSSAGGGASVAVGSALLSIGTDAGGSVRKPAAVTGVVGLKPTWGRISTHGTIRGARVPSVEHIGTFTLTAMDAAIVLGAIVGRDRRDSRTWASPADPPAIVRNLNLAGTRIGVPRLEGFGPLPDDGVSDSFDQAVQALRGLNAVVVEVDLPAIELALPAASTIIAMELAAGHRSYLTSHPDRYEPATRRFVEMALIAPAVHLQAAYRAQAKVRREIAGVFATAGLTALATPTLPCVAPVLATLSAESDMARLIQYTCPWSLIGAPAISVPSGLVGGLPVGLQIIGRPFREQDVLTIADAYESVSGWEATAVEDNQELQVAAGGAE